MIERAAWVASILACEGTPYAHQGRLPGVGLDCIGPLICAAKTLGLKDADFDISDYSRQPDGSLQPLLDKHLVRKPRAQLGVGDVVLNSFRLGKPQHIAVIVGELYGEWEFLHANSLVGRVMRERIQYGRRWYRYVQGYSVPGVAPQTLTVAGYAIGPYFGGPIGAAIGGQSGTDDIDSFIDGPSP